MDATLRGLFAGLTTVDVVHRLERLPGPDEKVTAARQDVVAGGPAANAASTFAGLGGVATLVTGLGRHPLAAAARADLAARGVRVIDLTPRTDAPPAVSAVRVEATTGRRSVSSPDAAGRPPAAAPGPQEVDALVTGADVVLLDGHQPLVGPGVAAAARATGVPVLLDAGRWREAFAELLSRADFVIASADFVVPSAGSRVDDPDGLTGLLAHGPVAVARTAGPGPVRWAVPGAGGLVAVDAVTGGDTLGAGDVFHGAAAFAIAAVGGAAALALWPEVLRFAADMARVRVEHVGPWAWTADPRPAAEARRWTS